MRMYISGAMRGVEDLNFPAFDAAKARLKAEGHEVISPADMDRRGGFEDTQHGYATRDINALLHCDAIYMLRGWENSYGAAGEFFVARWVGLKIICESGSADPVYDFCLANIQLVG